MDTLFYEIYHSKYRHWGFFSFLVLYIVSFPTLFFSCRFIGIAAGVLFIIWNIGCHVSNCRDIEYDIKKQVGDENPNW
jgi:hypothetical protein